MKLDFEFLTCTGWYLTAFDNILLGVYVAEAILKLYAMRHRYFKDGWNVFGIIQLLKKNMLVFTCGRYANCIKQLCGLAEISYQRNCGFQSKNISSIACITCTSGVESAACIEGNSFLAEIASYRFDSAQFDSGHGECCIHDAFVYLYPNLIMP